MKKKKKKTKKSVWQRFWKWMIDLGEDSNPGHD